MKKLLFLAMVGGLILVFGGVAFAGNTATQTVQFQAPQVNEIAVSGNPAKIILDAPAAGDDFVEKTDASTTYSFSTNQASRKITGQITTGGDMPTATNLNITLAAPGGTWTSAGKKDLSVAATAQDLATGNAGSSKTKTITYGFLASIAGGAVAVDSSRVVTLTLTAQ